LPSPMRQLLLDGLVKSLDALARLAHPWTYSSKAMRWAALGMIRRAIQRSWAGGQAVLPA
jgi:hypothetical protein